MNPVLCASNLRGRGGGQTSSWHLRSSVLHLAELTVSASHMDNKRFTVLLVEDDLNDIFLVKRAFKMAQVKNPLQVVTDGQEAVSYLKGEGKYADRELYPLP